MSALLLLLTVPSLVSGMLPSGGDAYKNCKPKDDGGIICSRNGTAASPRNLNLNKLGTCDFATALTCNVDFAAVMAACADTGLTGKPLVACVETCLGFLTDLANGLTIEDPFDACVSLKRAEILDDIIGECFKNPAAECEIRDAVEKAMNENIIPACAKEQALLQLYYAQCIVPENREAMDKCKPCACLLLIGAGYPVRNADC